MTARKGPVAGAKARYPWEPTWAVHPRETFDETIRALGLTQAAAAEAMGIAPGELSDLLAGRRTITPKQALRFEAVTGVRAEFWARLWAQWEVAAERERLAAALRTEPERSREG